MQEHKKISHLTHRNSVQKTIRMQLNPVGKTMDYFQARQILENDEKLKEDYQKIKEIADRFYRNLNEDVLSKTGLDKLKNYAEIYYHCNTDADRKRLDECASELRKEIVKNFKNRDEYNKLFDKKMIEIVLPQHLKNEDEKEVVASFKNFTTYFTGFFTNRKNMYSDGEESTAIAYRCINENLPKHLDNVKAFEKAISKLSKNAIDDLDATYSGLCGTNLYDVFTVDYFNFLLPQSGITEYNKIIGGYTTSDGTKVKGINEYINLYNQQVSKRDKIPNLKILYKQILSESEKVSFIPPKFEDDNELLSAVSEFYANDETFDGMPLKKAIDETKLLFGNLDNSSLNGIYIQNDRSVTNLSNSMFGSWSVIEDLWNKNYDSVNSNSRIKDIQKREDKRKKAYKAEKKLSLSFLQVLISNSENDEIREKSIVDYYKTSLMQLTDNLSDKYKEAAPLFNESYANEKGLKNDDKSISLIKNFLDAIKEIEKFIKPLSETNITGEKNDLFYSQFTPLLDNISRIDILYDKVRNYVTQKPFSTDKIKLNFGNYQLLNGWDKDKEREYGAVLLCRDEKYYLAIIDKSNNRILENIDFQDCDESDCYEKIIYKLLPTPNKMLPKVFFAKKHKKLLSPSDEILKIYKNGTFKKGDKFSLDDCHKLIDFYKESFKKYPKWLIYNFKFKKTNEYNDIREFYNDVALQGYNISKMKIPTSFIDKLVDEGRIYLFQLYNKDFSPHSKGTPNLHTLYFKMLFDERNLEDVVYRLNGEAKMFYRPASIKYDKPTHSKNTPIKNKNTLNDKKASTFPYDLIKDKRYTKWQFSLYFSITMNFKAPDKAMINDDVRNLLKSCNNNFIIGIDRGERNLLYVSVIDSNGAIIYQHSLNIIGNKFKGKTYETNYREKLATREKDRTEQRRNWKAIESIKELKEGYISQAVHVICQLVVKYDAIIVMEKLTDGFKRGRTKFEKQVYQKFEKMLIDKLNYYVDKKLDPDEEGGLLHAYQLTNKLESFDNLGTQSGFIFYVRPDFTSKIDPVTGFVNLLYPRYENIDKAKDMISRFDDIRYNAGEDFFEFDIDYDKFPKTASDYRKKWTICTNGERIEVFRNPANNNEWSYRTIILAEKFKELFDNNSINYRDSDDLKAEILSQTKGKFFEDFFKLLRLTLQMRNSNPETGEDRILSPVKDKNGNFYDSSKYDEKSNLPCDADANGAYNIARKGLWIVEQFKKADNVSTVEPVIHNDKWLKFVQENDMANN